MNSRSSALSNIPNCSNVAAVNQAESYPAFYERAVHENSRWVLERLVDHFLTVRMEAQKIAEKITVKSTCLDAAYQPPYSRTLASDAGHNGVDLRVGFLPLYGAVALLTRGWEVLEEPLSLIGQPEVWTRGQRFRERESLLAAKLQFQVTTAAVEKWHPDLVLFDGTIIVNPRLRAFMTKDFREDHESTLVEAVKMLNACYTRNVPVVGFVKRTRKHSLSENARDTVVLNYILKRGQYTVPALDEQAEARLIGEYRQVATRLGLTDAEVENATTFYVSYIRTGATTPFRLAIPKYSLPALENIAEFLANVSYEDGLPFALREVDELTRISTATSNLRVLALYSHAAESIQTGRLTLDDLQTMSRQLGEPWTLDV